METRIKIESPNEKQKLFLQDRHRYVAFGGARGGGKSWAVRTKAVLLAMKYPGIRMLLVRRTYAELMHNHVDVLRRMLQGAAVWNDRHKCLRFPGGSVLDFMYCAKDSDLDRLQGVEYDVIFLDEATQLSEKQMRTITACVRGVNGFPKRVYFTCNPGGQGHGYIKRLFIDRRYEPGENGEDYAFIQSLVQDNTALMKAQPEYIRTLEALPEKLREAWLYGKWDVFQGQFFGEFRDDPAHYRDRRFTHVIEPFAPPAGWQIYRSYDWGYAKPFSCGWWAVDPDGTFYRILELYGCSGTPDEGVRWNNEKQFMEIARIEREHPWLKGRKILGVADPSIWDASRGESTAETAGKYGVYFSPGDNARIPGWMQCRYRLQFDENGYAGMYVFEGCGAFRRTIPTLRFDERVPEDLDTTGEDHAADEWRYLCMARPVKPRPVECTRPLQADPLNQLEPLRRVRRWGES